MDAFSQLHSGHVRILADLQNCSKSTEMAVNIDKLSPAEWDLPYCLKIHARLTSIHYLAKLHLIFKWFQHV